MAHYGPGKAQIHKESDGGAGGGGGGGVGGGSTVVRRAIRTVSWPVCVSGPAKGHVRASPALRSPPPRRHQYTFLPKEKNRHLISLLSRDVTYSRMAPTIKLNSGHEMPLVGFGLWKVDNATCADTVYNAIKVGYRLFDGACGKKHSLHNKVWERENIQKVCKSLALKTGMPRPLL